MNVLKTIWKIAKWILLIVAVIIALVIAFILIQTKASPNKVPSIFGYKPLIVLSGSMETEIYEGDLVIVKKIDTNELKVNDIIAFRDENNYVVTHRIIGVDYKNDKKVFITKGDNNNTQDPGSVELNDVEGIYVRKYSKLGNLFMVMQKPITLAIVIGAILVFGIMWIMLDTNKLSKSERQELERLRKERNN